MELRPGLNHRVLSIRVCSPQTCNNGNCFCGLLNAVNNETFMGHKGGAHTSLTFRKQSLQIEAPIGRCILGVYNIVTSVSTVQFSGSVVSDSLGPRGLQDAGLPCPSPTPGACSNSCPSNQ